MRSAICIVEGCRSGQKYDAFRCRVVLDLSEVRGIVAPYLTSACDERTTDWVSTCLGVPRLAVPVGSQAAPVGSQAAPVGSRCRQGPLLRAWCLNYCRDL